MASPWRRSTPLSSEPPSDLQRVETEWLRATASPGLMLAPLLLGQLQQLIADFGADSVIAGIGEQVATTGKAPTPKYVRKCCESKRNGTGKPAAALRPEQQSMPVPNDPDPLAAYFAAEATT